MTQSESQENRETYENRYYSYAMSGLIESTKRRKELENNFDRSKRQEYDEVCEKQLSHAVELLKLGVDFESGDTNVSLLLEDGEIYDFPKDEIRKKLGEKTFSVLFSEENENADAEALDFLEEEFLEKETQKNDYVEKDRHPDTEYRYPEYYMQSMGMNPVAGMLLGLAQCLMPQSQMMPRLRMNDYVHGNQEQRAMKTGDDPVSLVQNLKDSRDKMREMAIKYKRELDDTKKKLADLEKESEELDITANQSIKELNGQKEDLQIEKENLKVQIEGMQNEIEKYEKTVRQLNEDLENNRSSSKSSREESEKRINELTDKINESKNILDEKQKDLIEKQKEIEEKQQKINQKQEEITHKEGELKEIRSKLEKVTAELKTAVEKLDEREKSLSESEKEKRGLAEELELIKDDLVNSNKQNRSLQEQIDSLTKTQSNKDLRISNLESENANLKEKIQNQEKKHKEDLATVEKERYDLTEQLDSLKKENAALLQKAEKLEKANMEAEKKNQDSVDKVTGLEEEIEKLNEEKQILVNVAYKDDKFGIGNLAGFNKRFYDKENRTKMLAIVDICHMKEINAEFEEEVGDNVIEYTIEALVDEFDFENVYRIRGGQFAVIINEGNYNKTRNLLNGIQNKLSNEKEFDIVFGLVSVDRSPGKKEAIEKARKEMNDMKKSFDLKAQANYGSEQMQMNTYPQFQPEIIPNMAGDSTNPVNISETQSEAMAQQPQVNPNIAPNIYNEQYEDDDNIAEVDATSMNLAEHIMGMIPTK